LYVQANEPDFLKSKSRILKEVKLSESMMANSVVAFSIAAICKGWISSNVTAFFLAMMLIMMPFKLPNTKWAKCL
jgi:hypothetical protein